MTAEQIKQNWEQFKTYIENYISSPRKEKLLEFYNKYEERFSLMPASHRVGYYDVPGGYIDHVNRVIKCAMEISHAWVRMGMIANFTNEELIFSAINHELGKFGDFENESFIPQTDEWKRNKLNEQYMFNDKLEYMTVPDRSLFILQSLGIQYSKNEMLAIKLHDGMYSEANKAYLATSLAEAKPRTSLVYIIHQAVVMASRLEFEQSFVPKSEKVISETTKPVSTTNITNTTVKQPIKNGVAKIGKKVNSKLVDDFFK